MNAQHHEDSASKSFISKVVVLDHVHYMDMYKLGSYSMSSSVYIIGHSSLSNSPSEHRVISQRSCDLPPRHNTRCPPL